MKPKRSSEAARLQRGPAYDEGMQAAAAGSVATARDWPTFRSDSSRSGSVATRLPSNLSLLWQSQLAGRIGPPVSVGDTIFVPLVDEHQMVAVNAVDGTLLWRFYAGGRIDSPPTYDRGSVLFGSADGWVYRVLAADGRLVWRLRVVGEDRRIGAFDQLESAWPVHGSVLVAGDSSEPSGQTVAYFVAGRSSHLDGGLRLCAIDAATGAVRHERTLSGPNYDVGNIQQNYLLPTGVLPDILRQEGSAIFMRGVRFDKQLQRQEGLPTLKLRGGFLDDAYFKRMPWSMGQSGHARLIVHDDRHAYCLRMFDSLQGLDPKVYFTPGKEGYLLFAHDLESSKHAWQYRIPIRGRAMVVTDRELCVAGPPDVVDSDDPLGAFEGRKGGLLRIVDKADGRPLFDHQLSHPPVFNGAAAAGGRLLFSLEDGSLVCFGDRSAS